MAADDVELIDLIEQLHREAHKDANGRSWPRRLCTEQVCKDLTREHFKDAPGSAIARRSF